MKLQRVIYRKEGGCSGGFSWHLTKRDAKKAAAQAVQNDPDEYSPDQSGPPVIEEVEVRLNREGIIDFLRRFASHPDNG